MQSLVVSFPVETSGKYLLDWLEDYLKRNPHVRPNWPYRHGSFYLRGFRRDSLGPVNADFLVNAGYYPDPKQQVMSPDNEFLAMQILTQATGNSSLSVTAKCVHPLALESFVTLLSELANGFPIAKGAISPERFGPLPYIARQRLSPPTDARWREPPHLAEFPLQGAPKSFIKRFNEERYGVPSDARRTTSSLPPDLDFIQDFCPFDGGWFVFLPAEISREPDGRLRIRMAVSMATLAGFSSKIPDAIVWEIVGPRMANPRISLSCNRALIDVFLRPALSVLAQLHRGVKDLVARYLANISALQSGEIERTAKPYYRREGGPTVNTETRADVFKKLKDEHPDWTQLQVAMEASKVIAKELGEELGEEFTADTVRNAYRAMGWKWPKRGKKPVK